MSVQYKFVVQTKVVLGRTVSFVNLVSVVIPTLYCSKKRKKTKPKKPVNITSVP